MQSLDPKPGMGIPALLNPRMISAHWCSLGTESLVNHISCREAAGRR